MRIGVLLASLAIGSVVAGSGLVVNAGDHVREIAPKVEALLKARDDRGWTAPERGTFWTAIRGALSADEAEIVADIADALKVNSLGEKRRQAAALAAEVRALEAEIAAGERAAHGAPPPSEGTLGAVTDLFVTTRPDLERRLAEKRALIEEKRRQIEAEKADLVARMNALGATLRPEDVEPLMAQVTADDLLELSGFYESALKVHRALAEIDLSKSDSEGGRVYYGVHVALVEAAMHMNRVFVERIDEVYLPKLTALMSEAKTLSDQAGKLLAGSADEDKKARVRANLKALELTTEVGRAYLRLLLENRANAEGEVAQLKNELETAIHTYRTVRVSSRLRSLVKSADESAAVLQRLKLPKPRLFVDTEMREEFERLTARMRPTS